MAHEHVLKQLFPIDLGGGHPYDLAVEGAALDEAQASSDRLLENVFPDTAHALLKDWERVLGIQAAGDVPLQSRRGGVVNKLREIGWLSRQYFISLAASLGWAITIAEPLPFMAGWGRAGDRIYEDEVRWIWRVNVLGQSVYRFRAGESVAGERLTWWMPATELEFLLEDLGPAHTYVIFNYT